MWTNKDSTNSNPRGFPFSTPQPEKRRSSSSSMYSSPPYPVRQRPLPSSEKKWTPPPPNNSNNLFHIIHKVPSGDSPYVRAKHVQLVDNNPSKAVSMFWAAINSGDRVDSALKDMAVVMKQLNRSDEAIEAIKSFRHLCPLDAQESLDNILLELYKRSGRIQEQIELLQAKLKYIEESTPSLGNRTKLARSQGKKIQITTGQEYSRKALSLEPDKNKRCNLAICLMYMDKMTEAKFLMSTIKDSNRTREMEDESYVKSYERAIQVMNELETEKRCNTGKKISFSSFLSRNKETDSVDKLAKKGNHNDPDPGFRKSYASPSPVCGTPRAPFTQPRRREWERQDSGGGCFRRLHFGQAAEVIQRKPSGNCSLEVKLPSTGREMSIIPSQEPKEARNGKKSWADMVEEDEQILLKSNWNSGDEEYDDENEQILLESSRDCWKNDEEYGDENEDCNIRSEKIECVQDGYQTQPGTATNHEIAERCLSFENSVDQEPNEDGNYWCSSPGQKEMADFNGGYSGRKGRLQVFQDIVLSSENRGGLE
ncbi:Tetratricopeptide-like helical [Cynara cardunculus var. scolymus]|uniref:Tetratricopeptide-like helical n=1 Tax=Cynara cardunculus var. scolymus TaxID=59895 RepID=A0A103Y822_CYNCS|nr:Tetratricopeptide-like helical [Cynara cardunculus var. scolymus]